MEMTFRYGSDASGDESKPVIAIGGWLASDQMWGSIEREWEAAGVGPDGRIPYLHMKDFGTHNCPFGTAAWSQQQRDDLLRSLANILQTRASHCFVIAIETSVYRQFLSQCKHPKVIGPPYSGCAQNALVYVEEWAEERGYLGDIAYVFENGDRKHELLHAYDEVQRHVQQRFRGTRSISFLGKETVALQAADLVAYEAYDALTIALAKTGHLRGELDLDLTPIYAYKELFTPLQQLLFDHKRFAQNCFVVYLKYWLRTDAKIDALAQTHPSILNRRLKSSRNQGKRKR